MNLSLPRVGVLALGSDVEVCDGRIPSSCDILTFSSPPVRDCASLKNRVCYEYYATVVSL